MGVDDDAQPVGIEEDFPFLRKQDLDGWELWLTDLLVDCMGEVAAAGVDVIFTQVDGRSVAGIEVSRARRPVFATPPKGDKREQFLVRINNSTRELVGREAMEYQESHWSPDRGTVKPVTGPRAIDLRVLRAVTDVDDSTELSRGSLVRVTGLELEVVTSALVRLRDAGLVVIEIEAKKANGQYAVMEGIRVTDAGLRRLDE